MNSSKLFLQKNCISLKIDDSGTCKEMAKRINTYLKYGFYKIQKNGNIVKNTKNIIYFKNHPRGIAGNIICPECKEEKKSSKFRTLCGHLKDKCIECRRKEEQNHEKASG